MSDVWDYRVVQITYIGGVSLTVNIVFYHDDGEPYAFQPDTQPSGGNLDELRQSLARFASALEKPVLVWDGDKMVELTPTPPVEHD